MVSRFGSREICDVTFKARSNNQKVGNREFKAGQPVFVIDTATTSNMEQAATTVYAQGGKGYNRLIAWEGEKTMTFTVTDALMSPLGLAVLSGAGFKEEDDVKHIHVTYDVAIDESGFGEISFTELSDELGLPKNRIVGGVEYANTVYVCNDTELIPYATILDNNGAIVDWADEVILSGRVDASDIEEAYFDRIIYVSTEDNKSKKAKDAKDESLIVNCDSAVGKTIKLDFYVAMTTEATEITIGPDDFGGNFYVEADTLYRNQDGKDMAATITFPNVKIQSGFTIAMAANGDPSTFDFVMDAFPAYTYFDSTHKVVCDITIVSGESSEDSGVKHQNKVEHVETSLKDSSIELKTSGIEPVVGEHVIKIPVSRKEQGEFNIQITSPSGKVVFRETDILAANENGAVTWNLRDYSKLDGSSITGLKYNDKGEFVYVNGCNTIAEVQAIDSSDDDLVAPGTYRIVTWMTGEKKTIGSYKVTQSDIDACTLN